MSLPTGTETSMAQSRSDSAGQSKSTREREYRDENGNVVRLNPDDPATQDRITRGQLTEVPAADAK